ncbi:MAG TPA: Do family serine endopeptidase [Burkholderiales bacterium]|jgi:Do/DeqQ family serine protease|nr:Do family serine endopeptidase [Burkholderiales bacterium]
MYRLWLTFAQAATIAIAVLFVVSAFHPEWLPSRAVVVQQAPVPPAPTTGPLPAAVRAGSFHEAVQRAAPSVVNISTAKELRSSRHPLLNDPLFRRFFGSQPPEDAAAQRAFSLGSGVVVSAGGYVLTNHHVVDGADEIEVALHDGKKLLAKVVGSDPETDLAVLRVSAENLPAISFGSSEALRVGDVVLAIGNPFNLGHTVTSGIVSALGRSGLNAATFENFIQTDAAINPGNSGGALIDAGGNLVGINTLIISPTGGAAGIGFAIPVSTAKMVLEQIIRTGSVTRGWIGVELRDITPLDAASLQLGAQRGALIAVVLRGGPADKAGVRPGDVAVEVQGKPVGDATAMLNVIAALVPGEPARMKLRRHGQDVEATVNVGRRPRPQPRAAD